MTWDRLADQTASRFIKADDMIIDLTQDTQELLSLWQSRIRRLLRDGDTDMASRVANRCLDLVYPGRWDVTPLPNRPIRYAAGSNGIGGMLA